MEDGVAVTDGGAVNQRTVTLHGRNSRRGKEVELKDLAHTKKLKIIFLIETLVQCSHLGSHSPAIGFFRVVCC